MLEPRPRVALRRLERRADELQRGPDIEMSACPQPTRPTLLQENHATRLELAVDEWPVPLDRGRGDTAGRRNPGRASVAPRVSRHCRHRALYSLHGELSSA